MPKTLKTFFILFLLIFLCSSVQAQKNISGRVIDVETGKSLPSTNILIQNSYRGTITNNSGKYTLAIPDSLLPTTLIVRYIGYQTKRREITTQSSPQQDFTLEPAITEMEEVVVTDEDPGMHIMRKVIKRKQEWRKKLHTYQAEAYTRQTLANDTSIVSITESASEVFWDNEQGHREVLKSKRQTANIEAADNLAGVSYLPNFYDDNVQIAEFDLVGVTHPDALSYYNFKLVDQTSLDNQTVFKIEVKPDRKLQPLFKGTVFVLEDEYALLEVDLQPNDVVRFPRPVKSFLTSYKQQFNNFGKEFWLPVDARISGNVKISMPGLSFPVMKFKQISRISDYRVNISLPDSLYQSDDLFSTDSTSIGSDSLISKQTNTVPLSVDEKEAYATLDSTASLEDSFKPSGFLAHFVDEDENGGGNSSFGMFNFLSQVPGSISPDVRFNRVDEIFAGLKYRLQPVDRLELHTKAGYSTGYDEWNYGAGFSMRWLEGSHIRSTVGVKYTAETTTRYTSHIYNPYYAIIPNLTGNEGYFGYYRSEGFRAFSRFRYPGDDLSLAVGFNSTTHTSLSTNTAYDFFGSKDNFRTNPDINEGRMQTVDFVAGYNLDESYNFGITRQKYIRFEVEHSLGALGSDFDFTRYEGRFSWSFPTFYQRRFLSNTLDIKLNAGTFSGNLPVQKLGIVDVSLGKTSPFGALKAARNRPYEGKQYVSLIAEHNFRTIPFEAIGLQPLVERDIGFIIFGGTARTWPNWGAQNATPAAYQPHGTDGIHWEAGASLNGIFGLLRLDFAARLDEPAFLVNISVARLF